MRTEIKSAFKTVDRLADYRDAKIPDSKWQDFRLELARLRYPVSRISDDDVKNALPNSER